MMKEMNKQEIAGRIKKLFDELNRQGRDWDAAFLIDKVNQYYLTGTMQDGVFVLKNDGSYAYFVRRSFERATMECLIDDVFPMVNYKDVSAVIGKDVQKIYLETELVAYGMLERIKKYFDINEIIPIDKIILKARAVKSPYELSVMEESGRQHKYLLKSIVPGLLREGMNEAEFTAELYAEMVKLGYHGVSRFTMFQTDIVAGQIGFGENSLYPTSFDGPGGMKGMHPASPVVGDRERSLKKGDLVFVDIGYGVCGYHTDKTQVYMFGAPVPEETAAAHHECIRIQSEAAALLRPGNIPSDIYNMVMAGINPDFLPDFMGFGKRTVKFLGHGVGLRIDEFPVITRGFDEPLLPNMTIALEPKKGIAGVGMAGVEDTYVVTSDGGRCITGGGSDIIVV